MSNHVVAIIGSSWTATDTTIEDLLVTLADKVCKGKRIEDLEIEVATHLGAQAASDKWLIYTDLAAALDEIANEAARRVQWQGRFASGE